MNKIGTAYLYDKENKKLQEIDKAKFSQVLLKYANVEELKGPYVKEIKARKNLRNIFQNASYEETIKRMKFDKIKPEVYSFGYVGRNIGIIVAFNTSKEKLQELLGLNKKVIVKKKAIKPKKAITKEQLLDWLAIHEGAFEDFCRAMGANYEKASDCNNDKWLDEFKNLEMIDIKEWIQDHDTLKEDYEYHFKEKLEC